MLSENRALQPTCLFRMSQIFRGGSASWLREFRLGCASLCTRYNGLDPRTAPWSGKIPAADTGSSTWYCHTTCIVSFWNTQRTIQSQNECLVLHFLPPPKNIDRETGLQRLCLCTRVAIKIGCFPERVTPYDANKRPLPKIARSAASFNQTFYKIYDRKLRQTNHCEPFLKKNITEIRISFYRSLIHSSDKIESTFFFNKRIFAHMILWISIYISYESIGGRIVVQSIFLVSYDFW